jgi:hypothetical protein
MPHQTAKAVGIDMPTSILLRAAEVIEWVRQEKPVRSCR